MAVEPLRPTPVQNRKFRRYSPTLYKHGLDPTIRVYMEKRATRNESWPLNSRFYDPLTMDATHISDLLFMDTQFTNEYFPWFLEYACSNDNFAIRQTHADDAHETGIFRKSVLDSRLTIVHVGQERLYSEGGTASRISLDAPTWTAMLEQFNVLPNFLELLHNNQGGSLAYISYDRPDMLPQPSPHVDKVHSDKPQAFHVGYKVGSAADVESAIYARHDFSTDRTLVMLFDTDVSMRLTRLQNLFRVWQNAGLFHLVFILMSVTLETLEERRWWADHQTQALESQTGIRTGTMHEAELPDAERLKVNRKLLVMGKHAMFVEVGSERMQSNLSSLLDQMSAYQKACRSVPWIDVAHHNFENLQCAAQLKLSLAKHQSDQAKKLGLRLQAQLDITRLLIAQRDTKLNIELAEAAKASGEINVEIAEATRRDSQLMRGIAAVTMIFLPATFVATFFSMVFFHVGNESSVRLTIDRRIWLYPTVTLPLTALVTIWYWTRSRYALWRRKQSSVSDKSGSLAA